ncbi:MAG: arsenosugar biosynthesis radical SAM protein ArsS [Proteobacteria bacterium]|nr:arsenosugar biosynthesis radical SAM protein ArsS [Pseudomonadota bacterium]
MKKVSFDDSLKDTGLYPLRALSVKTLQVNLGFRCNQACVHCHVLAAPTRTESMSKEVMDSCLKALSLEESQVETVDITGGAPEMHEEYRWFVESLRTLGLNIKTRTNLTILMEAGFTDLPEFFASNSVEVIASLPCYTQDNVDGQRGQGVFDASIVALKRLNNVGYGLEGTGLKLNLVYNPAGALLPPSQAALEEDYRDRLLEDFGIRFTNLFTITNMPIGRFKEALESSGGLVDYMELLRASYNPEAAGNVMCREILSVGYDGSLYDCDFNQVLGLKCASSAPSHIDDCDFEKLSTRQIITGSHCYGCTAGAGSSCGGTVA